MESPGEAGFLLPGSGVTMAPVLCLPLTQD